jgi:hypothetical protein
VLSSPWFHGRTVAAVLVWRADKSGFPGAAVRVGNAVSVDRDRTTLTCFPDGELQIAPCRKITNGVALPASRFRHPPAVARVARPAFVLSSSFLLRACRPPAFALSPLQRRVFVTRPLSRGRSS